MSSVKKIGFFWGEEGITVIEADKNIPVKAIFVPTASRTGAASPFSSGLSEEIQTTALVQKIWQDHNISTKDVQVALPMRDIILRSFVVPAVKPKELSAGVEFEAKKYIPFDIKDLDFVFHSAPFVENKIKRLRIVFFATRKTVMEKYERIFQQAGLQMVSCEPALTSLNRALLFKKEITSQDRLAFLYGDKSGAEICFIDKTVPEFVRQFAVSMESAGSTEVLKTKLVNEISNSFDFFSRQFGGKAQYILTVSPQEWPQGYMDTLAADLEIKVKEFSPLVTAVETGDINQMDAVFALGACLDVPEGPPAALNFLTRSRKKAVAHTAPSLSWEWRRYREAIRTALVCVMVIAGAGFFFHIRLDGLRKIIHDKSAKQGTFLNVSPDAIKDEIQQNADKLARYKSIRVKSDMAFLLVKIPSLLPQEAWLTGLNITYSKDMPEDAKAKAGKKSLYGRVSIDLNGYLFADQLNEQVSEVNGMVQALKNDPQLAYFVKNIDLISLQRQSVNGRDVTQFTIRCS